MSTSPQPRWASVASGASSSCAASLQTRLKMAPAVGPLYRLGHGLRIRSLAGELATCLPDTRGGLLFGLRDGRGRLLFGLRGLVLQHLGQLAGPLPGPRLDVGLGHERFDGLAELLAGTLDFLPELLGIVGHGGTRARLRVSVRRHRCAFSFTSRKPACTLSMASAVRRCLWSVP